MINNIDNDVKISPLMWALGGEGDLEMIKTLINNGADPKMKWKDTMPHMHNSSRGADIAMLDWPCATVTRPRKQRHLHVEDMAK